MIRFTSDATRFSKNRVGFLTLGGCATAENGKVGASSPLILSSDLIGGEGNFHRVTPVAIVTGQRRERDGRGRRILALCGRRFGLLFISLSHRRRNACDAH